MPRNPSTGVYTAPSNSFNPAVAGTAIDPSDWNDTQDDYVDALTDSLSRTGEGGMDADLDMADNDILNVGAIDLSSRIVTAAGAITIAAGDVYVIVRKTVPAATVVNFPAASTKIGPVTVIDGDGTWATTNMTFTPNGAETISGAATVLGDVNYDSVTFYPIAGVGWVSA